MINHTYKRNPNAIFYEYDIETYLLDEKNDEIITLNETGRLLWSELKKPSSIEELVHKFESKYIGGSKEILTDISSKLIYLKKRGMVVETKFNK